MFRWCGFFALLCSLAAPCLAIDLAAFVQEQTRDITGDGIPDQLLAKKGSLEARDGASGKVLWKSSFVPADWGSIDPVGRVQNPLFLDCSGDGLRDLVFVPAGHSQQLVALERKSGRELWSHRSAVELSRLSAWSTLRGALRFAQEPVAIGDLVLVPDRAAEGGSQRLVALGIPDGLVRWSADLDLGLDGPGYRGGTWLHVRADGRIRVEYYCTKGADSRIVRVGLADGARLLGEPPLFYYADGASVAAFALETGEEKWRFEAPEGEPLCDAALLRFESRLLLVAWRGTERDADTLLVTALDSANGSPAWSVNLLLGKPADAGGNVLPNPRAGQGTDCSIGGSPVPSEGDRVLVVEIAAGRVTLDFTPKSKNAGAGRVVLDSSSGAVLQRSGT